jgi:hypothetical protein
MNLTRRKIGAIALIAAGVGAFLVPFLLHTPSASPSSSNNNNGGHTTTTTPGTTTTTTTSTGNNSGSDSSGGTTGSSSCKETKSHDSDDASDPASSTSHPDKDNQANSHTGDSPEGHAYGYVKNQLDTTVSLVKSMGTHNPAFQSHHSTDTDNDTVHSHTHNADSDSTTSTDPSCTDTGSEQDD